MISEADVVRAALDLEADYLEDLGRADEARAVRARVPMSAAEPADDERALEVKIEALARRFDELAASHDSPAEIDPVLGDGFVLTPSLPRWDDIVDLPPDTKETAARRFANEYVYPWTTHSYFDALETTVRHDNLVDPLFRRDSPFSKDLEKLELPSAIDPHLLVRWHGSHGEVQLAPLSLMSVGRPLAERMALYESVIRTVELSAELQPYRGNVWTRYLRLVRDAGVALDIPGQVVTYVISYVSNRRAL